MTTLGRYEDGVLDDVRIAHDIRAMLWARWGQRSVPRLSIERGKCELDVFGSDGVYTIVIRRRSEGL